MPNREKLINKLVNFTRGNLNRGAIVSGSSGMGKSWILEAVGNRILDQPHRLIQNGKYLNSWAYSGLLTFLASIPIQVPAELSKLLRENSSEPANSFHIANILHQELAEVIAAETVFLIDDLDFMDPASQEVLGLLATRLQSTRISFILAVNDEHSPEPFMGFPKFRLTPLDRVTMQSIIEDSTSVSVDPAVQELMVEHARGVPLILMQHLESLSTAQRQGLVPLSFPFRPTVGKDMLSGAVRQKLNPDQVDLLKFLAHAPSVEAGAVERAQIASAETLDSLERCSLISRDGQFLSIADPLVRGSLYADTPLNEHRRHLKLLSAVSENPQFTAFFAAKLNPESMNGAELIAAATQLLKLGQYHFAIEVVEWTLLNATTTDFISELLKLARVLTNSLNLFTSWRYLHFALVRAQNPQDILELHVAQLELLSLQGKAIPLSSIYELVDQYEVAEPALCAKLLSITALGLSLKGQIDRAEQDLQRASKLYEDGGQEQRAPNNVQACLLIEATRQNHHPVLAEYQRLLSEKPDNTNGITFIAASAALTEIGQHQKASQMLEKVTSQAPDSALVSRLAELYSAFNAINAQDVPRGLKAVKKWREGQRPSIVHPLPKIIEAWHWLVTDRPEKVRAALDELRPYIFDEVHSIYSSHISGLEGEYAVSRGRFVEAITYFQRSQNSIGAMASTKFVETATNLIEAYVLAGRPEQAADEFRVVQSLMATVKTPQAKLMMRRAQAMALPGEASLARFESLLDMWKPNDSILELARIHHCYASKLLLMERSSRASNHLITARTLYRSVGALHWLRLVDTQLEAETESSSATPSAFEFLTQTEANLATMVRQGLTNKAIAENLFISISSVEARLTRLFRKTKTKNRQQLIAYCSMEPAGRS